MFNIKAGRGRGCSRVGLATLCILLFTFAGAARANTFTVTDTTDNDGVGGCDEGGVCSLRQAVNLSETNPGADVIDFDPGVFATAQSITIGSRLSDIHQDLSIEGPTAELTLVSGYTNSYALVSRSGTLSLSHLTTTLFTSSVEAENLIASYCTFETTGSGISAWTSSTVSNCRFVDCEIGFAGDNTNISKSVFIRGNYGVSGYGTVENCTFYGTTQMALENAVPGSPLTVRNCTFTKNNYVFIALFNAPYVIKNCIVAGNTENRLATSQTNGQPVTYTTPDSTNVIGTLSQAGFEVDAVGDPVLKLDGGSTETIALLSSSPAIDHNDHASLATDQRGVSRPQGLRDDAGAYELIIPDTTPPVITVSRPTSNQNVATANWVDGFIKGTASDDRGVTRVDVKLYKTVSGVKYFWDGNGYVTASTALAGHLGTPGGTSTTWDLSGDDAPTADEIGPGNFGVTVSAVDGAGHFSTAVTRLFLVNDGDITPPTVSIENPGSSAPLTAGEFTRTLIGGTITDNLAVDSVTVKFYSNIGGAKKYWNGTAFVNSQPNAPVTLDGRGTASGNWYLTSSPSEDDLLPGSYGMIVSGRDAAGNSTPQIVRTFSIVIETTPPTGTITSPANSSNATAAVFASSQVEGTADDDIELRSISVKLFGIVGGVKKYWDGTSFQALAIEAPSSFHVSGLLKHGDWRVTTMPDAADLLPGSYGVVLTVKDAAGNTSAVITRNFNIVEETNKPSGSILYPTNVQSLTATDFDAHVVNGTAADDTGVASVTVKLSRFNAGIREFWGDSGWQTASTYAPSSLTGGGTTSATWQLTNPPFVSDVENTYYFTVTIKDTAGNATTLIRNVKILPDTQPPAVHIYTPVANGNYSAADFAALRVEGDATDDMAIGLIAVKLYRKVSGITEYWNGSAWVTSSATAPLDRPTFGYTPVPWLLVNMPAAGTLDPGSYGLVVTATDMKGNVTRVSRPFIISNDQEKPVINLNSPSSTLNYFGSLLPDDFISGTITDNFGVASGSVKLYCTVGTTKYFWNGSDFVTDSIAIPMTLTGGATSKTWKLSLPPASLNPRRYTVVVSAKDTTGNLATNVTGSFTIIAEPVGGLRFKPSVNRF